MAIPLTKTKSAIPDEEMADFVYSRSLHAIIGVNHHEFGILYPKTRASMVRCDSDVQIN